MDDVLGRVRSVLGERYRIQRELGHGGMSVVYLADDLEHGQHVAVKVLRPELARTLGARRFLREIEIAGRLSHPGILPLHDSGDVDGLLYYVMPYVAGASLRERLRDGAPLAVDQARRILQEVTDALAHAHAHGLVHRDLKPENVLFQAGHAVLCDFGIARAIVRAGDTRTTAAGMGLGTPAYMSPEQALGEPDVDHRADLYALGVVAYEMLTGRPPFVRGSARALIAAHVAEIPRSIGEVRPELSPVIVELVMRCLEKEPARRPSSAAEVGRVLAAADD